MKKLLALSALLLFAPTINAAECPILDTNVQADLTWVAPTERDYCLDPIGETMDSTAAKGIECFQWQALPDSEIGGYTVYLTNRTTKVACTINVGKVLAYSINILEADIYDSTMTTTDTDNNESIHSAGVVLNADFNKPATADVTITQVVGTYDYVFSWPPVTAYEDGTALPDGVTKYYLFDNGNWVKDIQPVDLPYTRTLGIGSHSFEVEAEINTDGSTVVSNKTAAILLTVAAIKKKPHPAHSQKYKVNQGYKKVIE